MFHFCLRRRNPWTLSKHVSRSRPNLSWKRGQRDQAQDVVNQDFAQDALQNLVEETRQMTLLGMSPRIPNKCSAQRQDEKNITFFLEDHASKAVSVDVGAVVEFCVCVLCVCVFVRLFVCLELWKNI